MRVVLRDINWLKPYEANPRRNDPAVDAVARSIREFGFRQPIVADERGVILAGHSRWKAAKKLGLKKVPVHIARHLTASQKKGYRLADNCTADLSSWDYEALAGELSRLKAADFDLDAVGLTEDQLERLLADARGPGSEEDEIPEPPKKPVTRPGDLWLLGRHRLLCGDAMEPTAPGRVGFRKGWLILADPPFNMSRQKVCKGAFPAKATDTILLLGACHAVFTLGADTPLPLKFGMVVRKKVPFLLRASPAGKRYPAILHYHVLFFSSQGTAPCQVRRGSKDYVPSWLEEEWSGEPARKTFGWAKPVSLIRTLLSYYPRRCVYDPFVGSGTTILAAEQLGRRCSGVEICPEYVDVAVERWQRVIGEPAKLKGKPRRKVARQRATGQA